MRAVGAGRPIGNLTGAKSRNVPSGLTRGRNCQVDPDKPRLLARSRSWFGRLQLCLDLGSDRGRSRTWRHLSTRGEKYAFTFAWMSGGSGTHTNSMSTETAPTVRRVKMSKKAGVVSTSLRMGASTRVR
jgi:hypothetical protein